MTSVRTLSFLVASSVLLLASPAFAGPWKPRAPGTPPTQAQIDEASARYQKGIKLYEVEGDVTSALVELERAYDIAPNFIVLYNIGQVARTQRDYVTALRAFEAYLQYGGSGVPNDRRVAVETDLRALKDLVATVLITTNATEGVVIVDDIELGKLPMEALQLNPGTHKIVLQSGGSTTAKSVTVAGGEAQNLELTVTAAIGTVAPPPPTGNSSNAWIGWTVAGVLGAGAIATGSAALVLKSDLDDMAYFGPTEPDSISSKHTQVTALSVTTDVLIGCAVAAAGVSLYFTIRDATASKTDTKTAGGPSAFMRASPNGLALVGSF